MHPGSRWCGCGLDHDTFVAARNKLDGQFADDFPVFAVDHPFFMIVNLAVGGYRPGDPVDTTIFARQLVVDNVRVST